MKNNMTLCNHTMAIDENKKIIPLPKDDNYPRKFCKKCKQVMNTYSDIDNYFPEPKPRYVGYTQQ